MLPLPGGFEDLAWRLVDLGISHMGIALMVAQIGQWRKEL